MTDSLPQLVALEHALRKLGAPIAEHLRPGLTRAEVDRVTSRIGLRLPDDVAALWEWHDGAEAATGVPRFLGAPEWLFVPLEETVDRYLDLRKSGKELDAEFASSDQDVYWPAHWWPLVGNREDVAAILPLDNEGGMGPTPIRLVDWTAGTPAPDAPTLAGLSQLVDLWLDVIKAGAWTIGPYGWLQDWDALPQLARETRLA